MQKVRYMKAKSTEFGDKNKSLLQK